jgi:cell division protein FtsB
VAVLLFVLVILALGYTYPVRLYLAQETQIGKMQAAQDRQRAVIAEKAETVAKWQDEAYVRIQARKRLYYTEPGEVLLVVMNDSSGADAGQGRQPGAGPAPDRWYDTLFSSVAAANAEPRR